MGGFDLAGRSCDKCDVSKPISYGFSQTKCESCNDVASYVNNSAAIVRFLFDSTCPEDVEKTVGEDGIIKNEEDIGKEEEETTDQQQNTNENTDDTKEEVTDNSPTTDTDKITDNENEEVTDPKLKKKEPEDESSGMLIFIIIGSILIIIAVAVFAIWKIMTVIKRKNIKTQPM